MAGLDVAATEQATVKRNPTTNELRGYKDSE